MRALQTAPNPAFSQFFQTRKGLRVSKRFFNRVVLETSSAMEEREVATESFFLEEDMNDSLLVDALDIKRVRHLFTKDELCIVLMQMLQKQRGGGEGRLLNNCFANIFLINAFVVVVRWSLNRNEWYICILERCSDDLDWRSGDQAFYLKTT